ncbi:MAG TPA: hypothetical protein VE907_04425 [Gammaproteobacteria bacterium]|nr:hypothetical protein [Gammaproteobacteria bacterium]
MSSTDEHDGKNAPALAGALSAVSSEQPGSGPNALGEDDDPELQDITRVLNGSKAIIGKAVWSANNSSRNPEQDAQHREDEEHETEDRERQELMHLAEWNAQMTVIAGMQMTNAEAQRARQWIVDHDDDVAHDLVRRGRLRADQVGEFKDGVRTDHHYCEQESRGAATEAGRARHERWKHSDVGRAADEAITIQVQNEREKAKRVENSYSVVDPSRRSAADTVDGNRFPSAAAVNTDFTRAANTVPVPPVDTAPAPVVPAIRKQEADLRNM